MIGELPAGRGRSSSELGGGLGPHVRGDRRPAPAIGHVGAPPPPHRSTASSSVAIGTSSGAISTFTVIRMLPPLCPSPQVNR